MEYCEGGSLAAIMGKLGTLTEAQISVILKDMLIGLEYLHNQRIFHRDIKADNVLLTSDGFAKLGTFPPSFPSYLFPFPSNLFPFPPSSSLPFLLPLPFPSFLFPSAPSLLPCPFPPPTSFLFPSPPALSLPLPLPSLSLPFPYPLLSPPSITSFSPLLLSFSPASSLSLSLLLLYENSSPQFFVRLFPFREDFYITSW